MNNISKNVVFGINEFVKLISSEMSIIDLDIDRGDIDELIVKLYEDFKI